MAFGNERICQPEDHDWRRTPSPALQRCSRCKTLRHTAFVGRDGQARTVTHTKTRMVG